MTIRFVNSSNPAALGVRWRCEGDDDDLQIELAVSRPGGEQVMFAMRHSGGGWSRTSLVVHPERFGPIPTTQAQLLAYAQAFAAAGNEQS